MVDDGRVEPIPGEPAAVADLGGERALVIADYHAGIEAGLRAERGIEVPSRAGERRDRLLSLVSRTDPDRLVVLGDLMHSIGGPGGAERGELEVLFESLPAALDVLLVKGNHDGEIEGWLEGVDVRPGEGFRLGGVGVCHGHTWPAPAALSGEVLCLGHEHPCVRLEDSVGGSRVERVWLRGRLEPAGFEERAGYEAVGWLGGDEEPPEMVVFPAFNDLAGGTWTNLPDQSFLSPFLPNGLAGGEAYLLDGTRLGDYRSV
ncbi:metallophosphoesterase [Saliphagus sp. LR7]|uniref:metallophosphoesterase n=1 Tax=Saliphagus sp. LR7 TaxID=2282654 RepID=UPI000DF836FE|nr:metallophosphoesterase [Saliphagus sp. LR7]